MDGLLDRIQELETRARKMEGQLRKWKLGALLAGIAAIGYFCVAPGHAQLFPGPANNASNAFKAPFVVTGASGHKLLEVTELTEQRGGSESQDTLLTLFRNGQPAVLYRTTGKMYKDAYDPTDSYLNVVETWLYKYPRDSQGKIEPTPYLASSTALTRAGGSIAVFNEEGKPTRTPPFAARLSAKRGMGGVVLLYDSGGNEVKAIQSK
jgi:hypothetical protein